MFTGLAGSILGKLVLIGLTLAVFYHLANGIRHLVWDAGYGFAPRTATNTAWLVIVVSIVATAAFWGLLADDRGALMAGIRTPLGRARGMGSSKHGVGHFIAQRVTAIALVLLVIWALAAGLSLAHGDYDSAVAWLRSPVNAGLACLLAVAAFWHMQLGIRTIIEDYFAKPATKAVCLILNVFLCWAAGALTILSILKVALATSGVSV